MCDDLKLQDFAVTDDENLNCWIYGFEKFVTDPEDDPNPS